MFSAKDLRVLQQQTIQRRAKAFRPGTNNNHMSQWRNYLSFCLFYGLQDLNPNNMTICMYLEFLTRSLKSPQSINNYLSGVRTLHKLLDIPHTALDSYDVKLMLRAINISVLHTPFHRPPISIELLRDISHQINLSRLIHNVTLLGVTSLYIHRDWW